MRHLQRPGAKCLLAASLAVTGLIGCDQATTSPVEADPGSAATATDEPNAIEPADEDSTDTAAPSSGTASASVSASAPDTFLVGYDTVTRSDDRLVRRGAGGELGQGQTFGVDDPVRLAGVTVKVIPDGDHDDVPLSFTLYRFTGAEDYAPDEPITATGPFTEASGSLVAGEPAYVTFLLPAVELEPGTQYGFVVRGVGNHGEFAFQHLAADEYDGGRPVVLSGADWRGATVTDDQVFFLHGEVM